MLRKPGKLPAKTYKIEYDLEYGKDSLEIHTDSIEANDVVLLHDDLLATGGSAHAALSLLNNFTHKGIYVSFLIELTSLNGIKRLESAKDIHSLIKF